jgi:hypothetical protein
MSVSYLRARTVYAGAQMLLVTLAAFPKRKPQLTIAKRDGFVPARATCLKRHFLS